MARDEAMLVAQAARAGLRGLRAGALVLEAAGRPRGADEADEARRATRNVYLESSYAGLWLGQMTLDPISGAIVAGELDRLERQLFDADCAEAKERLGRRPRLDELARTSAQRRADALVEMATPAARRTARGHPPRPPLQRLRRLRDAPGRICELENGHRPLPLGPGALDGLGLLRAGHLLARAAGSTSACGPGSSAVGPAGPSSCGTGSAPTPTATSRPRAARATTSSLTRRAGRRPRRTGACSAGSTTACATSATDRLERPPPSPVAAA